MAAKGRIPDREVAVHDLVEFDALFAAGREEAFEDGMESEFSSGLVALVIKHGTAAVDAIRELITRRGANSGVASEALRWLGRMEDAPTYEARRLLLEESLGSPSPRVRDGAALGLSFMDDPHAVGPLREAIEREGGEELRDDLRQVLEQLESASRCR